MNQSYKTQDLVYMDKLRNSGFIALTKYSNCACHTNDVVLFTYYIREIAAVFFATNRHNYARWVVRYHLDLLNMDETHQGVRAIIKNGALTVRQKKAFSRAPVEQTVNEDAASCNGGLTYLKQLTSRIY